jgi:hypothetical protein
MLPNAQGGSHGLGGHDGGKKGDEKTKGET